MSGSVSPTTDHALPAATGLAEMLHNRNKVNKLIAIFNLFIADPPSIICPNFGRESRLGQTTTGEPAFILFLTLKNVGKGQDLTPYTITITCESDDRLWLAFSRDISKRQRREYVELLIPGVPPKELKDKERDAWLKTNLDDREAALEELLREVLIDGQLVFGGQTVQGAEAILAADSEEISVAAESFLSGAFLSACGELRHLGNAKRVG